MKNNIIKVAAFLSSLILVLAVLYWLSLPGYLDSDNVHEAVESCLKLDELLSKEHILWDDVDDQLDGTLKKMVADTDRFIEDVKLDYKIKDAIKAGKKDIFPHLQAIIIRRTLLRACYYHVVALLIAQTEPEINFTHEEKEKRIEAFMQLIYKFADQEANEYLDGFHQKLDSWKELGTPESANSMIAFSQGFFAKVTLSRMGNWRALNKRTKEGRFRAIIYQAEMRQLYHILYPTHAAKEKERAWKILTEFTNNPDEVDDQFIIDGLQSAFTTEMDLVGKHH